MTNKLDKANDEIRDAIDQIVLKNKLSEQETKTLLLRTSIDMTIVSLESQRVVPIPLDLYLDLQKMFLDNVKELDKRLKVGTAED